MNRTLLAAGLAGATAVALGAYAAHGLEDALQTAGHEGEGLAHRVENFQTGVRYQLHAALALLAIGLAPSGGRLRRAAAAIAGGALVFCGLLYVLAFAGEGWRWLGAVVPLGGLAMIAGWSLVAWAAFRKETTPKPAPVRPPTGGPRGTNEPNEALIRLEELLSHQQLTLQDLDETVTAIRLEADKSTPRLFRVEETVRRLIELQQGAEDGHDEPPPHY